MKRLKINKILCVICLFVIISQIFMSTKYITITERICFKNSTKETVSSLVPRFTTTPSIIVEDDYLLENDVIHLIKRPRIKFLKVPDSTRNRSCWNTECVRNKQIDWKMFTFVKSSCDNFLLRFAIRRTWGSIRYLGGGQFQTIFVIGQTEGRLQEIIEKEHKKYGDILQIEVADNYSNLVYKSLAGMQWAADNLPEDALYSVVDDDMFVNIIWVQEYVTEVKEMMKTKPWPTYPILCMYGHRGGMSPNRNKDSKYYCSYDDYRWPYWPDFCLGGMYTTSVKVAEKLWIQSRTESIVRLEDVWITGILRQKLGIPKELLIPVKPAAALHLSSSTITKQSVVSAYMLNIWKKMQNNLMNQDDVCFCN